MGEDTRRRSEARKVEIQWIDSGARGTNRRAPDSSAGTVWRDFLAERASEMGVVSTDLTKGREGQKVTQESTTASTARKDAEQCINCKNEQVMENNDVYCNVI